MRKENEIKKRLEALESKTTELEKIIEDYLTNIFKHMVERKGKGIMEGISMEQQLLEELSIQINELRWVLKEE